MRLTGSPFSEQLQLIRASTVSSGVKGLYRIACGEKYFIYLAPGSAGSVGAADPGSEPLFGELGVDGVEPRSDCLV